MSDQLETLAAILAEMRKAVVPMICGRPKIEAVSIRDVLQWADRIEAAAERERASLEDALSHCRQYAQKIERENEEGETRLDAEEIISTVDNEFAGIRPAPATGNAAAMREALQNLCDCTSCDWACIGQTEFDPCDETCLRCTGRPEEDGDCPWIQARAALSAPARNCDRPGCADVESAWATYCAETNRADCKEFARWLFARAEGGDHA